MIYNEFYENTGECETSFYLGCKNCKECRVEIYNKEVRKEMIKEERAKQRFYERVYGDEIEYDYDFMDEDPEFLEAQYEIVKEQRELEEEKTRLKNILNELKDADIVETAKSVVNRQIKEKNIEIYNFYGKFEKTMSDCYRQLFDLEINEMSEEELNRLEII